MHAGWIATYGTEDTNLEGNAARLTNTPPYATFQSRSSPSNTHVMRPEHPKLRSRCLRVRMFYEDTYCDSRSPQVWRPLNFTTVALYADRIE